MILKIIILAFALGGGTFSERRSARHTLVTSEYTFAEIREVYIHKDIQVDPEIRLTLKDILKIKYFKEYSSLHVDYSEDVNYNTLEKAFKQEMKYGSK